jgi:hypothetical protein
MNALELDYAQTPTVMGLAPSEEVETAEAAEREPVPTAIVDDGGDELALVGVTFDDLHRLAYETKRLDARRFELMEMMEAHLARIRAEHPELVELEADIEECREVYEALHLKVSAGLLLDDRLEGTARLSIPEVIEVTYPAPRICYGSQMKLREAFDVPELREAMGIHIAPTRPPAIRIKSLL